MFKSIKSNFIFFTIIFILLSVGIPTYFLLMQFSENFDQRSRIMLETTLDVLLSGIENHMILGEHDKIGEIVQRVAKYKGVDHLRIFDRDGQILYSSQDAENGMNISSISPHHVLNDELNQSIISRINKPSVYSTSMPIKNKPACQKCHMDTDIIAYLDVDTDLTQAERYFYTGSYHIIFLAIAIVLMLFFGSYILFNKIIHKPLSDINQALEEVERGNLDAQLTIKKLDEIGLIKSRYNKMVQHLHASQDEVKELHLEQLQRADKLVTLGELAAEMAHEVNNPAAIILSRADYLNLQAEESIELKNYSEDFQVIIDQIDKVSKITGNILKYSKKLPKKFSEFDLNPIVKDSIHFLEPRLHKYNISIEIKLSNGPTPIFGDPQQIEQVIINLVNNAIDALPKKGNIIISTKINTKNNIELSICDNGTGIAPEVQQKIFSPFYTTKAPDKGTGLGLYIVNNICKNHDAEIICDSEPGKRTEFCITFTGNGVHT